MSWGFLFIAIAFEIIGTTMLKLSNGLSNVKYSIILFTSYCLSLWMLSLALKKIDIATAYAVWSGFGILVITSIGVLFFKESFSITKGIFIGLILTGVVGLNLLGVRN